MTFHQQKFALLSFKTKTFHVAVGLLNNRSYITLKCGKDIIDTLDATALVSLRYAT